MFRFPAVLIHLLKKAVHGLFNIAIRKTRFSNGPHFHRQIAYENGGTSCTARGLPKNIVF